MLSPGYSLAQNTHPLQLNYDRWQWIWKNDKATLLEIGHSGSWVLINRLDWPWSTTRGWLVTEGQPWLHMIRQLIDEVQARTADQLGIRHRKQNNHDRPWSSITDLLIKLPLTLTLALTLNLTLTLNLHVIVTLNLIPMLTLTLTLQVNLMLTQKLRTLNLHCNPNHCVVNHDWA